MTMHGLLLNGQRATMTEFYENVATIEMLVDGVCVMTADELNEFIEIVEYHVQSDDSYHPVSEYLDLLRDISCGRQERARHQRVKS